MEDTTIQVSHPVHEELGVRKYANETFDDVLRRVLGLVPQTVSELTTSLPLQLQIATNSVTEEYIVSDQNYKRIAAEEESRQILRFISNDSNKVIYQLSVSFQDPPQRVNYRVEFCYRNPQGELTRAAQFRNIEEGAIDVWYRDSETLEVKENTRRGDNAGRKAAELVGDHVSTFVEQSFERWG